ncbi:esterase [Sporothrix schenckii 1099-18]|uniref:Esterase n=1 Tax=Sporothrix schenckii 1099-18 TaxID=1397361 RepID=A0A0F2MHJ3_SPOSC|nr:esterase [Sporothrix schenckii 1099-18]KJR88519.1 esterase [Sporothrix schenckii 1099-18]
MASEQTATRVAKADTAATDEPLDPAKHIEAHILPRLDKDVVDYYLHEIVAKASTRPVSIEYIRSHPEEFRNLIAIDTGDGSFPRVTDYTLTSEKDGATFPVRVYHPDPADHGPGPYPVHLNFHGGGFVLGDLHTEAQLCLSMREAGVVVVDVNYRHCPETLFGKAFEDAWAALLWTRASASLLNIDPDSVSLGGISAGAHISIVMQLRARDAGVPLQLVMATVPATAGCLFYQFYTDARHASFHEFHRSPILPWARVQYFADMCLESVPDDVAGIAVSADKEDKKDKGAIRQKRKDAIFRLWPRAWLAPLDATRAQLQGLAPAYIRTGELDSLRDEGEAFGQAVVAAGGQVTFKRYPGGVHTFMYLDFNRQKRAYDIDSVVALRQAHGFAALPPAEVEARVDRAAAATKAKRAVEKEALAKKKAAAAAAADGTVGDNAYA